jgi:hypothetical protein
MVGLLLYIDVHIILKVINLNAVEVINIHIALVNEVLARVMLLVHISVPLTIWSTLKVRFIAVGSLRLGDLIFLVSLTIAEDLLILYRIFVFNR